MSDSDTSDDDDDVFLDLLERFPSSDEVLAAVRKHRTVRQFQIFAEKGLSALTCDEIGKALDDEFIPWGEFHEDIVQSVSDAKGKTKSGAARGSVTHMNTKVELKKRFGNCKIEEFDTVDRKDAWRSVLEPSRTDTYGMYPYLDCPHGQSDWSHRRRLPLAATRVIPNCTIVQSYYPLATTGVFLTCY